MRPVQTTAPIMMKEARQVMANVYILLKVLTLLTSFIINNLNHYTTPYIFLEVFTLLIGNDLNPYIA
jgi:hypothetical protein